MEVGSLQGRVSDENSESNHTQATVYHKDSSVNKKTKNKQTKEDKKCPPFKKKEKKKEDIKGKILSQQRENPRPPALPPWHQSECPPSLPAISPRLPALTSRCRVDEAVRATTKAVLQPDRFAHPGNRHRRPASSGALTYRAPADVALKRSKVRRARR